MPSRVLKQSGFGRLAISVRRRFSLSCIFLALVLHVFIEHGKRLINLLLQLVVVVNAMMVSTAGGIGVFLKEDLQ